ncbi:ankyrin repeat domain-containing protein 10a isoform X2 [Mastacembelus armatus]|uniref:Ankyrin repeat domain 10a n=1 Tax=Mastacembelus armatus TaxID=205130 RepID=A0A7N9AWC7_9TELE|nr:ankyrin repeat domain-containing protein 10-like isoform X2 [Mastacembelus armatus]
MSVGLEEDFSSDEVFISRFPIHRACRDGDIGALVSLFEQLSNQAPLTAEDSCYGWTPIHWAAHYGQLECVVRLVQMGCEVNTSTSRFNQTPTHTAAFGGRPHCVVWLTQAGADVNRQDFVGEAPIHKAARSGSLECIQALLIAGAKPHLRNTSGQTAADLARAHGFPDCFHFVAGAQKHLLLQLGGLHMSGSTPCEVGPLSRKRLMTTVDSGQTKKARRTDNVLVQMHSNGDEEGEIMNTDSVYELNSDYDTKAITDSHHLTLPNGVQDHPEPLKGLSSPLTPPANQQTPPPPAQRSSGDMCGSLHLTGSPSSCGSHQPAWWGLVGADCGSSLHYGHYHGFGDTAEELTDISSGVQPERRHNQAVAGPVHLYHGS